MTAEELLLRRVVVSASGLLYWGGVLVQARRVRRHIGHAPNLKPRGPKEKVLWLGWFVVIAVWIGQPFLAGGDAPKPSADFFVALLSPAGLVIGLVLVVLGYVCTLWCYAAMGDAWRIGVNTKEKTSLIQRGPYRHVRHPIYLFQIVMLAGAALLLPTPASFIILALHCICVLIKAADEEKYLTIVHGDAYRDYVSGTGRLFPKWTRK
jgi:protein-S-isoprenylcysteine O-methyltransferase Ste14